MGKSRFEAMESAISQINGISTANADDKVRMDMLQSELDEIDSETKRSIEEIKNTPMNAELLKRKAENDFSARLKQNERACNDKILHAEQAIKQAEHDADQCFKQAQLDIEASRANLSIVKESASEQKQRLDVDAQQAYDTVLASIGNTDKMLALRIQQEEANGQKRKREIEIKLRALKAKDAVVEDSKRNLERFYNDVVEISKQPVVTPDASK